MAIEIPLNLTLDMVRFHVLVVFNKNELFAYDPTMREKMIIFFEGFDRYDFFQGQIVVLELFNLIFFVLHPKDTVAIKIKRYCDLRHSELPMQFNLIFISVYLVHVLIFDF